MRRRWRCVVVLAMIAGCGPADRGAIDATTGDGGRIDAATNGQFGDPCTHHIDCSAGYCVEPAGGAGGQCSRTCDNDCPTGWDCLAVEFPESNVNLCVPATGRLCAPCVADAECPGGGCLQLDGEQRCASACSATANCPTGYTCSPDASGTHGGMFCQPVTASCTCSVELTGAMRSCTSMNTLGTCWGTQRCSGSAWSACTANPPSAEICDGTDNDCNFIVDDGVGGGQACTNMNAFGSCAGVRTCGGAGGFVCNGPTPMGEMCNSVDDNCNGTTDEGFAGLGGLCNAGVGACLRFGSMRCNAAGTGIECGAVAATPAAETCNQLDDNCNGTADETFASLGMSCSTGVGVCTRFGTVVCRADTTATECSAVAGSPTGSDSCNYLDDDCDGTVDNSFRDPVSGSYNGDQNCGACGINCANAFPGAANGTGGCVVAGMTAACGLRCNAGAFNLNATASDGCEFTLDAGAIYVSNTDATSLDDSTCGLGPTGTGAGNHPCKTITFGLLRAGATSRPRVLVADATYLEPVVMQDGRSLLGGYRSDTWERHLATTATVIQGAQPVGGIHLAAVVATSITSATLFEGFVVRGPFNTQVGGNSYAIYVSSSNFNFTIRANEVFGGRGGPGSSGTPGPNGMAGANGAAYTANAYDSFQTNGSGACNASNNRLAYGGGLRTCATAINGGNGGGNNCTPLRSTQNSTAASPATAGLAGSGAGGGTAGTPGVRGYDAEQQGGTCFVPVQGMNVLPQFGSNGNAGGNGQPAGGVGGCSAAGGSVVGGHWQSGASNAGLVGRDGGGGGGGGAGGGAVCNGCNVGNGSSALLGGHGGGAGSGGCGGAGGGSGGPGGGAFGMFVTGTFAPLITGNSLTLGTGGSGGAGGIGGAGGLGGTGTKGGETGSLFCTGKGGRGGDGGDGGPGSGGGGGCGGSSFGVYSSGVGTPNYCASNTVSGGAAGSGGTGGFSGGNSGGNGAAGTISFCTSI